MNRICQIPCKWKLLIDWPGPNSAILFLVCTAILICYWQFCGRQQIGQQEIICHCLTLIVMWEVTYLTNVNFPSGK